MSRPRFALLALMAAWALGLYLWSSPAPPAPLAMTITPAEILADGYATATIQIRGDAIPHLSIASGPRGARLGPVRRKEDGWVATVHSGVEPGPLVIRTQVEGVPFADATLTLQSDFTDRESDGMPDAVELDIDRDQQAFRRWFTFLAEAQFFQRDGRLPAEINDCAALIRYAYREALHVHDAGWSREANLPLVVAMPSVEKYHYPFSLLGASLFRVKPGALAASDLTDGTFSQFADAQTLQRANSHFVTRDIRRAEPGDLLFYRHESADMPFHSMIYLGASQVCDDGVPYLIYHTGPDGDDPGEIRRPTVAELLNHPNPQWRPLAGNPTFLGVYRWNILPQL